MASSARLFPILLAASLAPDLVVAQAETSEPANGAVIAAERDRFERLTIPVTVNGAGPFRFLVDTGAQATVVTARVTDALGLQPTGRATLVAMASRSLVETITFDGLEFAGRRFDNLTAPLLRDRDIGADGIIGLDSLQELRVVIDFRSDTLTVADSPENRNDGYEIVVKARRKFGQMIITDAMVDGVRTALIIDTGSWHSVGNTALQRRLRRKKGESVTSTDVTGASMQTEVALVAALRIGPMGLSSLPVGFADSPAFAALGLASQPALILGMGNLRPFDRVAIDFASRRVLFDVPEGAGNGDFDRLFGNSQIRVN